MRVLAATMLLLLLAGLVSAEDEPVRIFGWWRVACERSATERRCAIGTDLFSTIRVGKPPVLVLDPTLGWVVLERGAVAVTLTVDNGQKYITRTCEQDDPFNSCVFGPMQTDTITAALLKGRDMMVRVDTTYGFQVTVTPLDEFPAAVAYSRLGK